MIVFTIACHYQDIHYSINSTEIQKDIILQPEVDIFYLREEFRNLGCFFIRCHFSISVSDIIIIQANLDG